MTLGVGVGWLGEKEGRIGRGVKINSRKYDSKKERKKEKLV